MTFRKGSFFRPYHSLLLVLDPSERTETGSFYGQNHVFALERFKQWCMYGLVIIIINHFPCDYLGMYKTYYYGHYMHSSSSVPSIYRGTAIWT